MRKILAIICVTMGLSALSVPFLYHFCGSYRTKELIEQFEENLEQERMEDEEKEEEGEAAICEENAALLLEEDVIGLIEIEALGLKYPIVEGADSKQLAYGIGHMPDTGAIGREGNCILAGHRGSRYGTYFKNLNRLAKGDVIKVTDKKGNRYLYEADSWEVVGAYDNTVKAQGKEKELTLLTCENKGTMRLIYHCVFREEPCEK